MAHVSAAELDTGLPEVCRSPCDDGRVLLIVRRPAVDEREVLPVATLDPVIGLVGDGWHVRPSSRTPDRSPHAGMQVTVMNARMAALLAGPVPAALASRGGAGAALIDRWALAGDQLYVDLDLSEANLPAGAHLRLGSAVIEVTAQPHTGCAKFSARFGTEALRFVNSSTGRSLRLRGLNARVVLGGTVRVGDAVCKIAPDRSTPFVDGDCPAARIIDRVQ